MIVEFIILFLIALLGGFIVKSREEIIAYCIVMAFLMVLLAAVFDLTL